MKPKSPAHSTANPPRPAARKAKATPAHFRSSWHFMRYVLEIALRDRTTMLDAITPRYREADETVSAEMNEVRAEIAAIERRIARHDALGHRPTGGRKP